MGTFRRIWTMKTRGTGGLGDSSDVHRRRAKPAGRSGAGFKSQPRVPGGPEKIPPPLWASVSPFVTRGEEHSLSQRVIVKTNESSV